MVPSMDMEPPAQRGQMALLERLVWPNAVEDARDIRELIHGSSRLIGLALREVLAWGANCSGYAPCCWSQAVVPSAHLL